jgi:hypothetical protein
MSLTEAADRLILEGSIEGNIFPKSERDVLFPLTIKPTDQQIEVAGSIYARSIEVESGQAVICGPIASRGDILVHRNSGCFKAKAGITTLSGLVVGEKSSSEDQLVNDCSQCRALIKGDIVSNQSVVLNNSVVFGSIKAVNCTLTNSIVLGTVHCEDHLTVQMSSIGGYTSREVTFEGICTLFNSLGETQQRPIFLPFEDVSGKIIPNSMHLYSALRNQCGMRITEEAAGQNPLSKLFQDIDWICINAQSGNNEKVESGEFYEETYVLSLGGRIADYTKLNDVTNTLTEMLRVGFEFEHYAPETKRKQLERIEPRLTNSEKAILESACT